METPRFGVPCDGTPCDSIGLSRDSHCHMPPQESMPSKLVVDPEVAAMAARLLRYSPDGRLGDEDAAWEALELERLDRELDRLGAALTGFAGMAYTEVS